MPESDGVRTWHIITGEYPPDEGGVADYTATVARALAGTGDRVHVWTSGRTGTADGPIAVHRVFGRFTRTDLANAGSLLDAHRGRARMLVQWVPHAFGRRGVNLPFALWLHGRAVRSSDAIDVMVHEPFMPFSGPVTARTAAMIQRAMAFVVLHAASRVFVGTPAWIAYCRPLAGSVPFVWTPIPSGVRDVASAETVRQWRAAQHLQDGERLIGTFGRGGSFQDRVLAELGRTVMRTGINARMLLIGYGSEAAVSRIVGREPGLASVVRATGTIDHSSVSAAIQACDLMLQPYADGICARHSSAAAVLAHGVPAVTNAGRFTETIWRESGAVQLVASEDPVALVRGALQVLDDQAERSRLAKAALALYDSRFDVRHTVAALKH